MTCCLSCLCDWGPGKTSEKLIECVKCACGPIRKQLPNAGHCCCQVILAARHPVLQLPNAEVPLIAQHVAAVNLGRMLCCSGCPLHRRAKGIV